MVTKIMILKSNKAEHERAVIFENGKKSCRIMSTSKDYERLAMYASYFNVTVEERYETLKESCVSPLGRHYTREA